MEKVLVPAGNQPDMAEISKEITKAFPLSMSRPWRT